MRVWPNKDWDKKKFWNLFSRLQLNWIKILKNFCGTNSSGKEDFVTVESSLLLTTTDVSAQSRLRISWGSSLCLEAQVISRGPMYLFCATYENVTNMGTCQFKEKFKLIHTTNKGRASWKERPTYFESSLYSWKWTICYAFRLYLNK